MIKPTELRLGNYVLCDGKVEVIHQINYREDIRLNLYADEYTCDEIEPIPLTPEWLGRCGGIIPNNDNPDIWQIGLFEFILEANELSIYDRESLARQFGTAPIIYLHQLQNLYFALTGEELNIPLI